MKSAKEKFLSEKAVLENGELRVWGMSLMYEKEKKEIKEIAKHFYNKHKPDNILEMGFGLGYTATEFQEQGIKRHVILEPHPDIYKDAIKWKEQYPDKDIEIIQVFSQEYETEERFDFIFDDRLDAFYYPCIGRTEVIKKFRKKEEEEIKENFLKEKGFYIRYAVDKNKRWGNISKLEDKKELTK